MSDLPAALRDPAAYPHRPARVEWLQTHISWLFFADHLVYKVKKPVELGFLDFRSIDARRHYCAEEVRLNAALAPGVYRRVVPIRSDGGAVRVGEGPGGTEEEIYAAARSLPWPELFDVQADPGQTHNLAHEPALRPVLDRLHGVLATLLDPQATDRRAKDDQNALVERMGGREAALGIGPHGASPAPGR